MNTNSELERIVHDWLDSRVVDPPHGSLASALTRAESIQQQRHRWLPGWFERDWRPDRRTRPLLRATVVATSVAAIALVATVGTRLDTIAPIMPAVTGVTHVVGAGDGAFATIGEAVEAAEAGDTVLVRPGTYEEALIIDKAITLKGDVEPSREVVLQMPEDAPDPVMGLVPFDGLADRFVLPERIPVGIQLIDTDATVQDLVVIGQGDGIAMLVHGGAPTLSGIALKHEGTPSREVHLAGGLFVEGGSAARVDDARFWHRVRIAEGSSPTITDSDFSTAHVAIQDASSALVEGSTFIGDCECSALMVVGGSTATFRDNTFILAGLDIQGHELDGTSALVEGNRFSSHDGTAVSVAGTAAATVTDNKFYSTYRGVRIVDASAEVRGNAFVGNWNSILLKETDATVAENTIRGGELGVSVNAGSTANVVDNLVENASWRGILVGGGSSPTIAGNTVCGSATNILVAPDSDATVVDNDVCPDSADAAD